MRKQIAAANWKMNLTLTEAGKLVDELLSIDHPLSANQEVILAVPFPYILPVKEKIHGKTNVHVAAQNCSVHAGGAFTGEVSAAMLASLGLQYVVLGHSERREYQQEDNRELAAKVDVALANGLKPIFCCGEPLSIRDENSQNEWVEKQLAESLFHLSKETITGFVIAYEPIWAIGTGRTASSAQAQEMHAHIRSVFSGKYGNDVAATISILYGGSVKASNASELFSQEDVDGGLVGGASLTATEFAAIIAALKQ